ncbi:MAG: PrsW family intramembrane metalloprotease, partial [Bacteroidota bacterium]
HFKQNKQHRKKNKIILRNDHEIFQKYNYLKLSDNDTIALIGNIGYSECLLESRNYSKAIYYLKDNNVEDARYKNFIIGKSYSLLKNYDLAEKYLYKELSIKDGYMKGAVETLVNIYLKTKNYKKVIPFVFNDEYRSYVSLTDLKDIAVINNDIFEYLSAFTKLVVSKTDALGILAALLICLIWLFYLRRIDIFKPEKYYLVFSVLLLGIFFSSGASYMSSYLKYNFNFSIENKILSQLVFYIFDVALIEEIVKILPLLLLLLISKKVNQPYDYIFYASVSALGFAFIENIVYFETGSLHIMHGRALISVVGHMFDSSIIAYGLVLSRYRKKMHFIPSFFIFLAIAAIVHGLYNFLLYLNWHALFIIYYLTCVKIWVTLINNTLNNSGFFNYKIRMKTHQIQFYLVISLTFVLAFEYLSIGYLYGPDAVNETLFSFTSVGSILILFLASRLSKFDLMKKRWSIIDFRVNPLHYKTYPLNFVGYTIELKNYYNSGIFDDLFPEPVQGEIIDRLTIFNDQIYNFKQRKSESNWFLVKLSQPAHYRKKKIKMILIKFKKRQVNLKQEHDLLAKVLIAKNQDAYKSEQLSRNRFFMAGGGIVNLVSTNE